MSNFYAYVREIAMKEYRKWHPSDEVLEMMYRLIAVVVRDGADTLTITPSQILESTEGIVTETADIADHERTCEEWKAQGRGGCTSFRDAMSLIYQHDAQVRQHFQLIEATPEAAIYRIISEPPDQGAL